MTTGLREEDCGFGECEKKDEKDRGLGEELRCDVPKFQVGFNLII